MVRWHQLDLARDLIQRHGFRAVTACRHHYAKLSFADQIGAGAAQARGKNPILRAWRAAALHVAKNRQAGFEMSQFLKLPGQAHRIALMPNLKRGDFTLGLYLPVQGLGAFENLLGHSKNASVVAAHRALGHGHDAETAPPLAAPANGLGDSLHAVGDFGNEDHVRSARQSRAEREPAGAMTHDLDHDDAMVAVSGTMQTVDGIGGDPQSSGVAKCGVGHGHVVVNSFWQRDDVDASLVQTECILLRAASAEANNAIDSPLFEVVFDDTGHVLGTAVNHHAMLLVTAGAENRAADGENTGKCGAIQIDTPILDQSAKTVAKTDDLHAVVAKRSFADAADGCVQAGAVASSSEDANALNLLGHRKIL